MNWRKQIILIVVLVAAILAIGLLARHTGNGSALTQYKAELRAKGEKLTLTELALPLSTNAEEVASREFFATNLDDVTTNKFRLTGPSALWELEFVSPGKARVIWRGRLHLATNSTFQGITNVSALGDWVEFDRQNENVAARLGQFRQALQHPSPDRGWVYQDTLPYLTNRPKINFASERELAFGLANAEIGALHKEDLNPALADLHALISLAQQGQNELMMNLQMFRSTVATLALHATWEALQASNWNEQQLAELQQHWNQVDIYAGLERGILSQRATCQIIMQYLRQSKGNENWNGISMDSQSDPVLKILLHTPLASFWKKHVTPAVYRMFSLDGDELFQLRNLSKEVEMCRLFKSNRPWPEIKAINSLINSNMQAELSGKSNGNVLFHNYMASAAILPNLTRYLERYAHIETQRRLTITAIALKRYELKHGQPPPSLARLVRDFLVEVPLDPMSGQELCYRLNPDATFVLYSVGEDGKDDGGQAGMGLWQGPDAVWPTAVTQD